ncbi:MAG: hypothetical protein Kow0010_00740 [Dehalococcoidia bacterium]
MAITMVLMVLVVFMFFAFSFDAGLWYFDHRTAQNQAEAAALAAVHHLPDDDTTAAQNAAEAWLTHNGASVDDVECMEFEDRNGDGKYETARVCLRRQSPGIFAALSGISIAWISAAATATVGPVSIANVMPWAVVPPDPDCDFEEGRNCQTYFEEGGELKDCGNFETCPFGLHEHRLYAFKVAGTITPGNFGAIGACGNGAVNYRDCITGESVSGFYEEGETVNVETQTGNLGQNTDSALTDRYPPDTWDACDVTATPDDVGMDPDGKERAEERYVDSGAGCEDRLVLVPIIYEFPQGSSDDILVLGVATFAIASWDRNPQYGDAEGTDADACGEAGSGYACGMVWGYLMKDAQPPGFLLEQISDTQNPFAPLLIALIE